MFGFLIFYFVFTGLIAAGITIYQEECSFFDTFLAFIIGFMFVPVVIGSLIAQLLNNELTVKVEKKR